MPNRKLSAGYTIKYQRVTYIDRCGLLEKAGFHIGDDIKFDYMERTYVIPDANKLVVYKNGAKFVCYMWPVDYISY